jgi:hypothetical protein
MARAAADKSAAHYFSMGSLFALRRVAFLQKRP